MTTKLRRARSVLATALVLVAGVILAMRTADAAARTTVVAYFDNSNGVFAGDDVLIRGVPVGKIVKIEPQPLRAKISFWFDRKYRVPADAAAAILSPQLVTGRAIQLTPPYAGGPTMADGTVIPQERTVVPVEWDDLRAQLQRLTALLQPTRPGGVSTLGALINTAADNLRGQGATIRDTIIKLSQAISALGDHSKDIFSTVTNLSTLVTALHDSADLLERLNHNLAAVTSLLADGPDKIGQAAEDLNAVVADVGSFAAEHREAIGTASDKLASITTALVDSLDDIKQTSDLKAEVHSHTAIGETYVELLPRNAASPPLKNGDVIALADTSVPPDINDLLSAANTALEAIPHENLQTVIDESYTAVAGLGLELSRLIKGSAELAIDARANLDPLVALIDRAGPVLDSQTHTSDAIAAWAAQLAAVTGQLQTHDSAVGDLIDRGGPALGETRQLLERLQPTVPILLANLVSVGQVALTYHNDIEQLLVVFPMAIAAEQAGILANLNTKQAYRGQYLSFNLNLNLPPPCTTGFLPAQQRRIPTFEDYPDRPAGDLYCRVPQDSPFNVRGARNIPCETVPGKRAPTVKLCESDEPYLPLNDGYNWKGDPNATVPGLGSGQDIPQTWQTMLLPPGS